MTFNYTADQFKAQARKVGSVTLTVALYSVAIAHTLIKETVSYCKENSDEIQEDLKTFWNAVVVGTKNSVSTTYQLGVDSRKQYETYKPVVQQYTAKSVAVVYPVLAISFILLLFG